MLTINLIPKSFYERRIVRQLFFSFIGLWVLIAAGMVAMTLMTQAKIDKANADLQAVEPIAQQVESLQKQASDKRSEVAPIMAKVKYINDVMAYNTAMIPILQEVIRYTYKTITYPSVQPSGNTLTIQGWCPSIVDAGRYLMGLYRATHLFSSVTFSGVPGYRTGAGATDPGGAGGAASQGGQLGFSFTVTCTLVKPIAAPAYSGAGGAAAGAAGAAGAPGAPGMPAAATPPAAPGTPAAPGAGVGAAPPPAP